MPDLSAILERLRAARAARADAQTRSHAARIERVALQRKAARIKRAGAENEGAEIGAVLERGEAEIVALGREERAAANAVAGLIADLHRDQSVEALTGEWSSETPILLLPLRVETRFKGAELLVRVFPDEIAIDTHEPTLTVAENDAAEEYWRALAVASGETAHKEAWRKLAEGLGAPRAAYVARHTKPTNWDDVATVGPGGLTFPAQAVLKDDRWTEAPRVRVLPDRLVLMLLRAGAVVHSLTGAVIDDIVHAGPAPLQADGNASWKRDADRRIAFDAQTLWLKDFDTAVAAGLGFRVRLGAADAAGFDELIVLGLMHSADETDGAALVSALFEGHRYSAKGLALVPQGAATNNTSGEDAGFDSVDWFADASYAAAMVADAADDADLDRASDGRRLAAYLGVDPDLFRGVPNADRHDHAEAVAMNAALYSGTLGYFLRTMIGEVAGDAALAELRALFTRSVTGRGPLAALRVGNQPYGVVLAGPPPQERVRDGNIRGAAPIDQAIERIVTRARPYWTRFLPKLARVGATANASADLVSVLGLQPTAAEYFQRIAASYDHLANVAGFQTGGDRMDEVFESVFGGLEADALITSLGYQVERADGSQKPYPLLFQLIHNRFQTRIPTASLIDGQPFSETDAIKPYDAAGTRNYIDWLVSNARNANALRAQDFAGAPPPTALLYMLLRHALLVQTGFSVHLWLKLYGIEAPELVVSRKFVGMTPAVDVTAWEILAAPANGLVGTIASDQPLMALVHLPEFRIGPNAVIGAPLDEMLAAYGVLRGLPTARLERLFAEHVDTLSYRIDAWETALIDRRLRRRRAAPQAGGASQRGLYLGAVGYLEGVKREPGRRRQIEEGDLPPALREGRGDLYAPIDGAGFFHTPSLNHATAGAILRNGYLTHATPGDPGRLAVNLSSRRVRRAKELMDGVRNGQPLEVLVGIEFERALHDATTRAVNPVVLNDLKPQFRAAFPIRRTRIPKAGHADDAPEIVPDYSVANGVGIAATPDTFPSGVAGLPALAAPKAAALKAIRDELRDSLDALKDVITAESAYQLALGNFDRSAAIVQSLAGALAPPEIEVTRSSRGTDLAFTQRLTLQLDPARVANPWPAIALTPCARMEPPLNAWIGDLLGDPTRIACKAEARDAGAVVTTSVSAADLALQPIDLLRIGHGMRADGGPSELETRVREAALTAAGLSDAAEVTITFAESGVAVPNVASFADALSVLDLLHQVITGGRALDGRDSRTASKPLAAGTDSSGIDVAELRLRFTTLKAGFVTLLGDLGAAVTAAQAPGAGAPDFATLRAVLRRTADAGVPFAFPVTARDGLLAHALSIGAALTATRDRAIALETASNALGLTPPQQAERLIKAAREFLGADFPILPRYVYPNAADVAASDAARDAILVHARGGDPTADPVGEALTSVAHVRRAVHRVHRLSLMHDVLTGAPAPIAAIQLPHRVGDIWMGAALPPGREIFDDTLSVIQLRPQGFAAASLQCGFLIDEWVESFPRKNEVTGLAFGFDQPSSAPLQVMLLAVAGEGTQRWSWNGLVAVIRDTVLRAKLRAVEPDMLDGVVGVTTLLPATMAEFSTSKGALSLDYGMAVPAILAKAIEIGFVSEFAKEL